MNQLTRRSFIKNTSGAGIAFMLGFSLTDGFGMKKSFVLEPKNFSPYILFDADGGITIFNTKPEMGQGTFQSIPSLIAEEFEVSLSQVTIRNSNGEKALGPGQRAGGSSSVRSNYTELRKVGAAAREMFITAASNRWGVPASECYAANAKIFHRASGRSLDYAALVDEASKLEVPKQPSLKDPKDFKILNKPVQRPDIPLKVCGKAEFGIDAEVPGMVYASVQRCPVLGGTLKHFDATDALKLTGVEKAVEVERIVGKYHYVGVAVIAKTYWAALQGRKALKIEWDNKGFENFNSQTYEKQLRVIAGGDGVVDKNIGAIETIKWLPQNTVEAFYETPMVAHHPLEPMNCIAQVVGEKVEIWTSTQVPSSITGNGANDLQALIGCKPENITLHNYFIGGGFGRRLYLDFIVEAVFVARQINAPVKLIWTREDTTQFGPFRPMTFSSMKGVFAEDGKLAGLVHKVISPSYLESMSNTFDKSKVDGIMVEGIGEQAYEIPNVKTFFLRADYHIPVAAWRSVTSSTLAFAHECFMDELAHKAKMDPMAFRLSLLTKPSDEQRVLLKLKEVTGWDKPLPPSKGRGVAIWKFFAGLCAQVVEVTYRKDKSVKIDKVTAVIDLGEVVNQDNVKNQVEGAIIMALTAAVKPCITLEMGKVKQRNFNDNPLLRINEAPKIEVIIRAEGGKIKGVGEPGLPPFAPALANAIFSATGRRIRKMPFDLNKV